jgi:trehalose 2-sulfotransferase
MVVTDSPPVLAASRVLNEERYDLPEFSGRTTNYMICSTPRSGSILLSFLLLGCRMMGVPHEYLHATIHMPALARRFGLVTTTGAIDIDGYIERVRKSRTTANGVFGLKVHHHQLAPIIHLPPIKRLVETASLIRIRRRDLVGQAISYYVANVTQLWSTFDERAVRSVVEPAYNASAIDKCLKNILAENASWEEMFVARAVPVFDIWYEDLVVRPDAICLSVCKHLGVNPPHTFDLLQTGLQRLANDRARDWKLRFCAEFGVNPHL